MDNQLGQQHPLENSLVLHHIFQRCSLEDLKSCRLVSRLWRDSSRLAWRSSAVVKIHPYEMGKRMCDFQLFSKKCDLGQGQMQITDAPFINFHLRIDDSKSFYSFWGPSVKVLKLESVKFESRKEFVEIIFKYCQNLEKLTLLCVAITSVGIQYTEVVNENEEPMEVQSAVEQIKWDGYEENKKLKSITLDTNDFAWEVDNWTEFLSRLPSLESVTLMDSISNSEQFFLSVKAIRELHSKKLNLKQIDIRRLRDISPAILPVLLDANLQLEYLDLGRFFLKELGDSVPEILNKHASSLQKIILLGDSDDHVFGNNWLPSLRQLKDVQQLTAHNFWGQDYPLIKFLRLTPNLRKVEFWSQSAKYLGVEDLDISATQDIRLICCTELELIVPDLTADDLKHLTSWMPNLKKLKTQGLNNEMFSMVCEGWPKLVKLDVSVCKVNDSGISGLDAEDVAIINKTGRRAGWRPTTVPRANISCLKELQTFSLRAAPLGRIKRDLGFCAVVCGIELVPNLKRLNIENFNMKGRTGAFWKNVCAQYPWPEDED